jgi:hypothetical protein
LRVLGIRARRQVALHLSHCEPCRHYARLAGADESLFRAPRLADKVAALLPFGWLAGRRTGANRRVTGSGAHSLLARTMPSVSHLAEPLTSSASLGRVAAAVLAIAAAGGGYAGVSMSASKVSGPPVRSVAASAGLSAAPSRSVPRTHTRHVATPAATRVGTKRPGHGGPRSGAGRSIASRKSHPGGGVSGRSAANRVKSATSSRGVRPSTASGAASGGGQGTTGRSGGPLSRVLSGIGVVRTPAARAPASGPVSQILSPPGPASQILNPPSLPTPPAPPLTAPALHSVTQAATAAGQAASSAAGQVIHGLTGLGH